MQIITQVTCTKSNILSANKKITQKFKKKQAKNCTLALLFNFYTETEEENSLMNVELEQIC